MKDQALAPVCLRKIENAELLDNLDETPGYFFSDSLPRPMNNHVSCAYCGVGDSGFQNGPDKVVANGPTSACLKLRSSGMRRKGAHPIHITPSLLDRETGRRKAISYDQAIARFADELLRHRQVHHRSLVYASGQVDYFAIFAMQEVFRLLGIRNLTGNAEHCLNAGAVHNETLTGQEGPFLTIDQALEGENRFYIMSGWNGKITHPPIFQKLCRRKPLNGYLIEVMDTETARGIAKKCGDEHVLFIRPRSDSQLALSVAHEILRHHSDAIEQPFIQRFSDTASFASFKQLALDPAYEPLRVAQRIAPEPQYEQRLLDGIRGLARELVRPGSVPIAIPSVGLSQSSGIVAHCLWGNILAMLGKYGLRSPGNPAGGVLRVPGQINAETEVQGLSRKFFMGRIPMADSGEAARRMGLPKNAYRAVVTDEPRAALDYSDPTPERELFICFGTWFQANMPNRTRWLEKLKDPRTTLIVIDPIPDTWTEKHADLIIPSPPHSATPKLYQNGEWRLTVSVPQKRAAPQTRSDATIIYDAMAQITSELASNHQLAQQHPDLMEHFHSGYLQGRFCQPRSNQGGLPRVDGEVNRAILWERIQAYLHGDQKPLYCSFDDADGHPIQWDDLLSRGSMIYGGVGVDRYLLDYENPDAVPFRNIYRDPGFFTFFRPTERDLDFPTGIVFNSGRAALADDRRRTMFAMATFNSGKATPVENMPDEHPLYVSSSLACRIGLNDGDMARVTSCVHEKYIELPVRVSNRVKGDSVYVSFHRSGAQRTRGLYINDVTDHLARCPYSGQVQLKINRITLERVALTVPSNVDALPANKDTELAEVQS